MILVLILSRRQNPMRNSAAMSIQAAVGASGRSELKNPPKALR